ncbi:LLM class flavin-dependent oxidoreductase [Williamsia sp. MIQD14]|uniref:LLM class flavin-dependent oxidoreductase n=1 Tax=Williamsia sp. MIQD14 TaxID=3425703 RepID=UPI003DA18B46
MNPAHETHPSTTPAVSVLLPFIPRRVEQILPFAALVQWTDAVRLWQGQSMVLDTFGGFTAAAAAGFRVPSGVGVALMPLRHPLDAIHQATTAAIATGESFSLGIGPGDKHFQAMTLGAPYARQLAAVREYATILRDLIDHREARFDGEYFHCHSPMAAVAAPPVRLGFGVLRERMAHLAGELADEAITWLTPPDHVAARLAPALADGARDAGRPRRPRIVAMVPVALDNDSRNAIDIVLASNRMHISAPHYRAMLSTAGIAITDDLEQSAHNLIEGRAFLHGSVSDIIDGLAEYHRAGVDEVVLNTTGVCSVHGREAAMSDLREILSAIRTPVTATV